MFTDWQLEIRQIAVYPIAVHLISPFETSFGVQQRRTALLVRVETLKGAVGWGEVVANDFPGYSYETTQTALHILNDFLVPALRKQSILSGADYAKWDWLHSVRGHPLAKHGILSAILSALALEQQISMAELLRRMSGAAQHKSSVSVGVSIGIQPSIDATLATIEKHVAEGYRRVKLKIKPGWDAELLRATRAAYPDLALMADANSAYTLDDADLFKSIDDLGLLMIEQPFAHDDLYEHSKLQAMLQTPICLDESIETLTQARLAHEIGAGRIINLKPQRVGGMFEAVALHNFCAEVGLGLWVGGMLETGIGRAMSIALAALPHVTLPSDISATKRYYQPDIAEPAFDLIPNTSEIAVPTEAGLGVSLAPERFKAALEDYQAG